MGSLDMDSFFTNIPLRNITICTKSIYNENDAVKV